MSPEDVEKAQNQIDEIINDSLTKILSENSHFTEIQLETLLIELQQFVDKITNKKAIAIYRKNESIIIIGFRNRWH